MKYNYCERLIVEDKVMNEINNWKLFKMLADGGANVHGNPEDPEESPLFNVCYLMEEDEDNEDLEEWLHYLLGERNVNSNFMGKELEDLESDKVINILKCNKRNYF